MFLLICIKNFSCFFFTKEMEEKITRELHLSLELYSRISVVLAIF